MKLHEYITKLEEEWHDSILIKNKAMDIFVNPTQKEIQEITSKDSEGYFRFIANGKTKKLYIFDLNILHRDVADKMGIPLYNNIPFALAGVGKFKNNKITFEYSFNFENTKRNDKKKIIETYDWGWLEKWLPVYEYFSEFIKLKNYTIKEEWADSVKRNKGMADIFKNPTLKEIQEVMLFDVVRFIAFNKVFYVFSPDLLHEIASDKLRILGEYESSSPKLAAGVAKLLPSGKLKVDDMWNFMELAKKEQNKFKKIDWSWADKWINIDEFVKNYSGRSEETVWGKHGKR